MAAWWLDEAATTAEARERAYGLYRQADDWRAAARLATWPSLTNASASNASPTMSRSSSPRLCPR